MISMHVESICRVARSFILSALSASSLALSHMCLARANSDCASSISRLVSSLTRSAYAFSIAARRICSAASHFKALTLLVSTLASPYSRPEPPGATPLGGGRIGRRLIDSCKSSEGANSYGSGAADRRLDEEPDGVEGMLDEEAVECGAGRSWSSLWSSSSIGEEKGRGFKYKEKTGEGGRHERGDCGCGRARCLYISSSRVPFLLFCPRSPCKLA